MPASYLVHGLRVTSEVPLPDVAPAAADRAGPAIGNTPIAGEAAVGIDLQDPRPVGTAPPPGDLILEHALSGRLQYAAARTTEGVRFRVPAYGDFDVTQDLAHITCTPAPDVAEGHLPIMLTGNVLSFLLTLAGHTVLHAGAVEVAGGVVAAVGPSGVGKSTLTAWLCAAGARLVSDDVLRLDRDGTCHRGGHEVRLRARARPLADTFAQAGCAVRTTADGRCAVRVPAIDATRLPLRAVVIPRPRPDATDVQLHDLDSVSAALMLAGVPRTLGWRIPGPTQAHFTTVTDAVARVAVHIADVPWGPPFDVRTGQRLLELLAVEPDRPPTDRARSAAGPSAPQ